MQQGHSSVCVKTMLLLIRADKFDFGGRRSDERGNCSSQENKHVCDEIAKLEARLAGT